MQLFIDGGPHGLEFSAVVLLQGADLGLHRFPHSVQLFLVGLRQLTQLLRKQLELGELGPGVFVDPPQDRFIILVDQSRHFFPQGPFASLRLLPRPVPFLADQALQPLAASPTAAAEQQQQEQPHDHDRQDFHSVDWQTHPRAPLLSGRKTCTKKFSFCGPKSFWSVGNTQYPFKNREIGSNFVIIA